MLCIALVLPKYAFLPLFSNDADGDEVGVGVPRLVIADFPLAKFADSYTPLSLKDRPIPCTSTLFGGSATGDSLAVLALELDADLNTHTPSCNGSRYTKAPSSRKAHSTWYICRRDSFDGAESSKYSYWIDE